MPVSFSSFAGTKKIVNIQIATIITRIGVNPLLYYTTICYDIW